ncbi:M1 family metallopeptidase [Tamlana fucoidanivorans]|uniref:Aminopeptidase N n=1 Tax=Allotamlana fucoidanivorans TaxID=2583814 RepID=A0A5C4SRX5_9FLAO|nr:M1 family metallopeptidase [Tamlana fucoidanivorans]TNJ46569.1 M1 family metallopeptidase [Tamlana fucoidanivorans]
MKCTLSLILVFIPLTFFCQQVEFIDFKRAKAEITFGNTLDKEVLGTVDYKIEILKDIDSVYLDAKNFQELSVKLDNHIISHSYDNSRLIIKNRFKANATHVLKVTWKTKAQKAMYFIDWAYDDGNKQIWTQGQGKYTSHWLPSIDDLNEKMEFDISITFNKDYEVISNGKLVEKKESNSMVTWRYNMEQPMSSYLVALVVGKYKRRLAYSKSNVPLEMYYYPKDSLKFEPTYRYTEEVFNVLENEIGVSYPWQNYKMVPVKDFLYAGMENTSLNIYSDAFVIDSIAFNDKNFVNINAHELAHQWFGDLVTETSGTHHWLQEGFATYYALLVEKEIFGEAYYYWRLYEYVQELLTQDKAGLSTSLLNPKSSSATFYKKGAWALHILREQVGDVAFKAAVKNYLEIYQYKNVESDNFISEVEKVSGEDLSGFVAKWLLSKQLFYDDMENYIASKSEDFQSFFKLNFETDIESCMEFIETTTNSYLKSAVIKRLNENVSKRLFKSDNIMVRQALTQSVIKIPIEVKADYETLLYDASYITIETALFNLWRNFPYDRIKYLNQTKDIEGFHDKNIRMLWLTLALITEDYHTDKKKVYFDELTDYTGAKYGFDIRMNAFQYLSQIQACHSLCKANLKQATNHHNWQFKKFAKQLLETKE